MGLLEGGSVSLDMGVVMKEGPGLYWGFSPIRRPRLSSNFKSIIDHRSTEGDTSNELIQVTPSNS